MVVDVFYQELSVKAIREEKEHPRLVHTIASKDWRSPIFAYLNGTYEPLSKHKMDRMNSRTKQYSIISGELYKSGVVAPMLKCISREQGIELLSKMHAGMWGRMKSLIERWGRVYTGRQQQKMPRTWSVVVKTAICSPGSREHQLTQQNQSSQHGHYKDGESTSWDHCRLHLEICVSLQ